MPFDFLLKAEGQAASFSHWQQRDRRGAKEWRRGRLNEKATSPPFPHRQRQQDGKLLQTPFYSLRLSPFLRERRDFYTYIYVSTPIPSMQGMGVIVAKNERSTIMNALFQYIYDRIVKNERATIKREASVDALIAELVKPYQERLSAAEMDILKDMLSTVALAGEQAGFEIGMKFSVKLIMSLLAD